MAMRCILVTEQIAEGDGGTTMATGLALVTGASSGIGLSLAKELAARGYDLVISSAGVRLDEASQKLAETGVLVMPVQADLATREGIDELWSRIESMGSTLDVACVNAGVGVGGLFQDTDLDEELKMVDLNCSGTIQLAKYVVQQMLHQGFRKDSFHRINRGRDGGTAGSRLCRHKSLCAFVRA